jgi:uncharacterized protein YdhG (YjbR/CyaY superfamily)
VRCCRCAANKQEKLVRNNIEFSTIDEYIATFPKDVQKLLQQVRKTIKAAAPDAEEKISYQIPTFALKGNLVHFAAYKSHLGFYPGASGIRTFAQELSNYQTAKGTVQFPLSDPLPLELIANIVKFRAVENLQLAELKATKKAKR